MEIRKLVEVDPLISTQYIIKLNKAVTSEMNKTNWGTSGYESERYGKIENLSDWIDWVRSGINNNVYHPEFELTDNLCQLLNNDPDKYDEVIEEIILNLPIYKVAEARYKFSIK